MSAVGEVKTRCPRGSLGPAGGRQFPSEQCHLSRVYDKQRQEAGVACRQRTLSLGRPGNVL